MPSKKTYKDRLTYSIGQVAAHTSLPQSVLRYWETVFPHLNPAKSPGGSRQYSDTDISIIQRIKELLYENGFTIKGANIQMEKEFGAWQSRTSQSLAEKGEPSVASSVSSDLMIPDIQNLQQRLKQIIRILED